MIYVIMGNSDGTEHTLFEKTSENLACSCLTHDVDGEPMSTIQEFEADSWHDAVQVFQGLVKE